MLHQVFLSRFQVRLRPERLSFTSWFQSVFSGHVDVQPNTYGAVAPGTVGTFNGEEASVAHLLHAQTTTVHCMSYYVLSCPLMSLTEKVHPLHGYCLYCLNLLNTVICKRRKYYSWIWLYIPIHFTHLKGGFLLHFHFKSFLHLNLLHGLPSPFRFCMKLWGLEERKPS